MREPHWAHLRYRPIDYDAISYYSAPTEQGRTQSLADVDPKLLATYEKLGVPLHERARLAGWRWTRYSTAFSVATHVQGTPVGGR